MQKAVMNSVQKKKKKDWLETKRIVSQQQKRD